MSYGYDLNKFFMFIVQAEINEAISTRNMNKENHRPHSPLTGTRSNPIPDKKGKPNSIIPAIDVLDIFMWYFGDHLSSLMNVAPVVC